MRRLFALCLFLFIGGIPAQGWSEDTPGATPTVETPADKPVETPADKPAETPVAATNSVAEALAVPMALHEHKYWQLRLDVIFFRPLTNLPVLAIDDPDGDFIPTGHTVLPALDQDNNLRPSLLYHCSESNIDFEINYFNAHQTNEIGLPIKGAGIYWSPITSPSFYAQADAVDATISFRFIEFNALIRHTIKRNADVHYFVDWGFRWAQITQHLNATFFNADNSGEDDNVDINTKFNGAGLAFGTGFEYSFWQQFTLRGRFGGALLQGSLSGSFFEVDTNPTVIAQFSRHETALVPELEAAVNLNWDSGIVLPYAGRIGVNVGYEMKNYFQVVDLSTFVDDIHTGAVRNSRSSFASSGYVVGLQCVWIVD